jgi:hypothetical protein
MDGDGAGRLIEQHSVIANTEPKQAFVLSRKPLDPSVARFGIAVQGFENAKGGLLRDGSEFGRHVWLEPDFLHAILIRLGCRGSDPS